PASGGLESTVLDLTQVPPRILRPGLVTPMQLEEAIGPVARPPRFLVEGSGRLRRPGMLPSHYGPRTPRACLAESDAASWVLSLADRGLKVGWLTFATGPAIEHPQVMIVRLPAAPEGFAAQLYAALHQLDSANLDRIVAA